jgi:hypothetical protein
MNLQRISEFAENQEGKAIFIKFKAGTLAQLTFGSFRLGKLDVPHHF